MVALFYVLDVLRALIAASGGRSLEKTIVRQSMKRMIFPISFTISIIPFL
jgi:hypothetical protein